LIKGDDGRGGDLSKRYYGGALIKPSLHRKHSPDGIAWKWWQCAHECAKHPDCKYWYIPKKTKNCAMRKTKSSALVAASFAKASEGMGHGDKDPVCDGVDPDASCRLSSRGCDPCTRIEEGDGFFGGGKNANVLRRTSAPNGRVWAWYQCAAECTKLSICVYWYIHPTSAACVLKSVKAGRINQLGTGGGHGLRSESCTGFSSRSNIDCAQLADADLGFYGGARLKALTRKEAPARQGFAWYECAGECSKEPSCAYWYVTTAKVCVLRSAKAGLVKGSKARAHGERPAGDDFKSIHDGVLHFHAGKCDGYCPSSGCDADHPRVMGKWQKP